MLGGQTVKNLLRLACKFDLDQSERKSSQVNASTRKAWPNGVASKPKLSTCVHLRLRLARALSPGQTESQVDASWKLGSTCDSYWPGLACTCVDLRWLALTLVKIKSARKSKQVFHRLAIQPKSTQVEWRPLSLGQTESQVAVSWELGSACDSVWPGLACTCVDLRWLALTFVEIKFARKSTQVFHRLATQSKSTQVEWRPLTYY